MHKPQQLRLREPDSILNQLLDRETREDYIFEPFFAIMSGNSTLLENVKKVIDPWISYQLFMKQVPSISVGITYDDKIIFQKAYGYSDLSHKKPATTETTYRIASISKFFTATAIMQLVDDKRISLDDPIADHLDTVRSYDEELGLITIRQCLSHLSGLTRDGDTSHWANAPFPTMNNLKKQLENNVICYEPLERFKYSNFAFGLLGEVIKQVTREKYDSYDNYVKERIFKTLGLTNTSTDLGDNVDSLAWGYSRFIPGRPRKAFRHRKTSGLESATGYVSNTGDLCKFLLSHINRTRSLVSDISEREMQRPSWVSEDLSEGYGLGYQIWKIGSKTVVGHSGGFQGFITRVGIDMKSRIGVVVLTNSQDGPAKLVAEGIFRTFDYFEENQEKFKSNSQSSNLAKYAWSFSGRWGDLEVVVLGDKLYLLDLAQDTPMSKALELTHKEGDKFVIDGTDGYNNVGEIAKFEFDKNGKPSKLWISSNPILGLRYGQLWKQV